VTWRFQPPVATPIDLHTLGGGLGAMFTGGRSIREGGERALPAAFGARAVLLADSGTSALTLALLATGGDANGPVALPAYGCFDLATAVVGADARVVFYDLDPRTLQPERTSLVAALAAGPRALIAAHLFGLPVDLDAIAPLLPAATVLIDDAAQAAGATIRGRRAGAGGDFGVLSFGRGKGLGGGGGGGLFATSERAAALLEGIRGRLARGRVGVSAWGALAGQWVLGRPSLYGLAAALPFLHLGETRYRAPGRPRGMALSARGVLAAAMARTEADLAIRRRNAERFDATMRVGDAAGRIVPLEGSSPGYLRYPVVNGALARGRETRRLGVQRGYPISLSRLPVLAGRVVNPGVATPGAERLAEQLVTFPTHRFLRAPDLRQLEDLLRGNAPTVDADRDLT
jgi:dTDP-4-amino-4,6-dideoxygalactose transaminase